MLWAPWSLLLILCHEFVHLVQWRCKWRWVWLFCSWTWPRLALQPLLFLSQQWLMQILWMKDFIGILAVTKPSTIKVESSRKCSPSQRCQIVRGITPSSTMSLDIIHPFDSTYSSPHNHRVFPLKKTLLAWLLCFQTGLPLLLTPSIFEYWPKHPVTPVDV